MSAPILFRSFLVVSSLVGVLACGGSDPGPDPEPDPDPTNNAPTLTSPGDQAGTEDTPGSFEVSGISAGDSGQTVTLTVTSSRPELFSELKASAVAGDKATISYTPAPNANGSATLTITANDGQASNATKTVTVSLAIAAVNDAPTISAPAASHTCGRARTFTITGISGGGGADESAQTVTVEAVDMSNPRRLTTLTVSEVVDGTATVSYEFDPSLAAETVVLISVVDPDNVEATKQVVLSPPPLIAAVTTSEVVENAGAKFKVESILHAPQVTDGAGAGEGIVAEVGVGPRDADPTGLGWTWTASSYAGDQLATAGLLIDMHTGWATAPAAGSYDVAVRYTCGDTVMYVDRNGQEYSSDQAVKLQSFDPANENIGFCNIQFPASHSGAPGSPVTIYGRVYVAGLTDTTTGPAPGVAAQLGLGPVSTHPDAMNPLTGEGWSYAPATFNVEAGNDDEYQVAGPLPDLAGDYRYVYRFRTDGAWVYCDTDGNVDATNGFDPQLLGSLTVTP